MDSGNILSILNFLGSQGAQQPPGADAPDVQLPGVANNVLQAAAPQQPPPPQIPAPPQVVPPQAVAQAAVAASAPMPKPRHSLADIIGHIADGIAQAGGATPTYQKTIDAMQEHATKVDMDKLDLATKQAALTGTNNTNAADERTRFANVLDAVNDPEDAAKLPQMMAAVGLTDPKYAAFIKMVQDDPDQAKVLSTVFGGGGDDKNTVKYGGQTIPALGPDGKIHIFQANITGGDARDVLPPGYTPVDPQQFINTGPATVGVHKMSGLPGTIIPNGEKPGFKGGVPINEPAGHSGGEPIKEKPGFSGGRPTAPAPGKETGDPYTNYANGVNSLRSLDQSLGDLASDPRLNGATGLVAGHLNVTADQRAIKAKIDALVGQGIPAAIAAIKASGGAAPRSVAEIMGEVKGLQGALQNRDQATPDYIALVNAARQRLRTRINEMTGNAVRQGYAVQDSSGNVRPAPQKTAASPASSGGSNLPTLSPEAAAKLPSGHNIHFRTLDGREKIIP